MLKIKLNPDAGVVKELREKLQQNEGFCPCELLHTPDTKCMCKAFREQTEEGYCHCGLYYKEGE